VLQRNVWSATDAALDTGVLDFHSADEAYLGPYTTEPSGHAATESAITNSRQKDYERACASRVNTGSFSGGGTAIRIV
jgi:hypothetical protein